ncbi:MAG: hypothetical protein Q3X07_01705, partial [Gemmiger sp.]|nr:hypothetical protein [Gemmiger sp.]
SKHKAGQRSALTGCVYFFCIKRYYTPVFLPRQTDMLFKRQQSVYNKRHIPHRKIVADKRSIVLC